MTELKYHQFVYLLFGEEMAALFVFARCHRFNLYQSTGQSVFCLMCNPENRDEVLYSACNMTGLWKSEGYGHETEEKCLNMPTIHYYAPYKNVFCKQYSHMHIVHQRHGLSSFLLCYIICCASLHM
jgi:hypothetical protein